MGYVSGQSWWASPISVLANGQRIGTATASVWAHQGRLYIVSNWHVLSGRSVYTGQPRHSSGAVPDEIEISYKLKGQNKRRSKKIKLHSSSGENRWIQTANGQDVDVAAIDITDWGFEEICSISHLKIKPPELAWIAGSDVYVLGYPLTIQHQVEGLPIWKRASIATEPTLRYNGKEVVLVDTATREGMSGAPVLVINRGVAARESSPGLISFDTGGESTDVMGIYSGRHVGEAESEAQLGIVWKTYNIQQLLKDRVPGDFIIRN